MKIEMEIEGLDRIEKKLIALGRKEAMKVGRKVVRPAAQMVLKAAKAEAPVKTGTLRKSLKIRPIKARRGSMGFKVGAFSNAAVDVFYAPFVMWGHGIGKRSATTVRAQRHKIKDTSDRRGRTRPNDFLRRVSEATREQAVRMVVEGWKRELGI